MLTVLVLTVGGEIEPIVRSIVQNKPNFIHFLCSDDSENARGSYELVDRAEQNIVTRARVKQDQYEVHRIKDFDDLGECYVTAMKVIEGIWRRYPESEPKVIVDYTGGTKSMSAGLATAALDDGRCDITIVTGMRVDRKQVSPGTETAQIMRMFDVQVSRKMRLAQELINRFDYYGAEKLLEEAMLRYAGREMKDKLRRWIAICRAFDAWDRFDHRDARRLLQSVPDMFSEHKKFLSVILEGKGHGFELVEDLLLNAERRAFQGLYDDAVARLYRATEMVAQVWLRKRYGIDTAAVDAAKLPESVRNQIADWQSESKPLKLGLRKAWELICLLPDDELHDEALGFLRKPLQFIEIRNNSILAHGQTPVSKNQYQQAVIVTEFLRRCVETAIRSLGKRRIAAACQLPTRLD